MFKLRGVQFFKHDTFESCKACFHDLKEDEYNAARGIKKKSLKKKIEDKSLKKGLDNKSS
jgi:hypothetical protein